MQQTLDEQLPVKTVNITFTFQQFRHVVLATAMIFPPTVMAAFFCFGVVPIDSHFMPCYNILQKFIGIQTIKQFLADCDILIFLFTSADYVAPTFTDDNFFMES